MRRFFLLLAGLCFYCSSLFAQESWADFVASKDRAHTAAVKKIQSAAWWQNCIRYGQLRRSKNRFVELEIYRAHVIDKNLINGIDLMNVADRTVGLGMTTCGVYASLGEPDAVNAKTSGAGTSAQIVYRNGPYPYIYTAASVGDGNGLVRSFSQ